MIRCCTLTKVFKVTDESHRVLMLLLSKSIKGLSIPLSKITCTTAKLLQDGFFVIEDNKVLRMELSLEYLLDTMQRGKEFLAKIIAGGDVMPLLRTRNKTCTQGMNTEGFAPSSKKKSDCRNSRYFVCRKSIDNPFLR